MEKKGNSSPKPATSPANKVTRTTRMIYVEEISDTEKDNINKSFKSFKMKTKVESSKGDSSCDPAPSGAETVGGEDDSQKKQQPSPAHATGTKGKQMTNAISPSSVLLAPSGSRAGGGYFVEQSCPTVMRGMKHLVNPFSRGPKALAHGDELQTLEDSLLYQNLKPLFVCMKSAGLFFIRRKTSHEQGLMGWIKNCTPCQGYCIFIFVILTLNFLRSLSAFESNETFGTVLFFKFLVCIFFYEAASRSFLALLACGKQKHGLQSFFLNLEKICYSDKIIPYEHSLKRTMNVFLIMTLLISIANVGVMSYGLLGSSDVQGLFNLYLTPVPHDLPGILGVKLFLLLLTFVNTTVAILSLSFYTIVCYVLYKEFEYLCRTFAMKIKEDGNFSDDLEKFRIRHQRRCKLVEEADQMFKYYIANTYLTNVPLLCLLLYSIVYTENEDTSVYRFISTFRLIYVLLQMLVLSVIATMINDQAHAPLADIYSIRVQTCTKERQLEVTMFLNKLTGTSIGLTAWDMFVINKPTVLTVIGMILTYFFLLMQFKNPLQGTVICNCLFEQADGSNVTFTGKPIVTEFN